MTLTTKMPRIDLDAAMDALSLSEFTLLCECIKRDGTLRASKPTKATGEAKYLWRMTALGISPKPQHSCMPALAFCDLPQDDHAERRAAEKRLNDLATRIEQFVPVNERHGTIRWAGVLAS